MSKQEAIYVRSDGKVEILDHVVDGRCFYSKEPLETAKARMAEHGYTLEVVDSQTAWERQSASYITEPVEITAERFEDLLEVLPPQHWHSAANFESFQLMEKTINDVTLTCVRIGRGDSARYFSFEDVVGCLPRILEDKVLKSEAWKEKVLPVFWTWIAKEDR